MRREEQIGKWAAIGAVLLAASACSPQCGPTAKTPLKTTPVAAIPSPSPTPTAPLQASSPPFHGGEVGVAYGAVSLSASGGVAPYTWSVSSGSLPPGLTLGKEGAVAGTPSSAGSFSFTIQVADAGDASASIPGTIGIAPALTAGLISSCAQYCSVELGCVNACGGFGQQSGGAGPYAYTLTQGPLPAGTSLNGLSLNGTFKGTSGWLQFTVQVSDSYGATASVSPRFWMYDHISLSGGTCGPGKTSCKVTLAYTGGTPGQSLAATASGWSGAIRCGFGAVPLPCQQPSLAVVYQPGSVSLTLTYQANSIPTYGTLTVQLASSDPCGSPNKCSSTAAVTVNG
ncbi:MAG TPA: Ig domain-containing protein [Candidatus Dormibacteraeota bacterium]|nr:Ig domain-containing protein [Candidatus Dormibacteraeota bacterium]